MLHILCDIVACWETMLGIILLLQDILQESSRLMTEPKESQDKDHFENAFKEGPRYIETI